MASRPNWEPTTWSFSVLHNVRKATRAFEIGNIVTGVFQPVLAKHSKSFNLIDTLCSGLLKGKLTDRQFGHIVHGVFMTALGIHQS